MSPSTRPPFSPSPCLLSDVWDSLKTDTHDAQWIPVCACPADFPIKDFDAAISQLVHHPEYNSTLILRSEIVTEAEGYSVQLQDLPRLHGFRLVRNIRRRLLPRRPGRDPPIEQNCTFYAASHRNSSEDFNHGDDPPSSCLVLTPKLKLGEKMPFYHPAVHHIAFRYLSPPPDEARYSDTGTLNRHAACLRIEIVPHSDAPDSKDVNSRLYRTCLALLETVHRYGWGILTNYQKRVYHDCLVSREEYQDLYLVMRERHNHLVREWHESTDPLKHVFEDIGIATFLMLLWKQDKHAASTSAPASLNSSTEGKMPWHSWPRPPGGFLDFGCGNGLLVHILVSEGYAGEGIDVRARTSWSYYPPETQARLHVHALNPLELALPHGTLHAHPFLQPGAFVIANHADELSPWTPVLATLCGAAGFLSIPCCPWSFDARFERAQLRTGGSHGPAFTLTPPEDTPFDAFVDALRLGGDGRGTSAYSVYRIWLATLSLHCGWAVECETLRIPSTRNWAIVGRSYYNGGWCDRTLAVENANSIIHQVRERGLFKTRRPEGKAGEH